MKDRFGRSDYRFLAVCLALLTATVWFSVRNFYRAFPEASIDFRVSRAEGESIASAFLAGQRYDTAGYRKASSFTYDDDAKTFLEREAGLERANQLMGTRVRLWQWSYRWFRPLEKEEFRADVTPRGEVIGFRHEIAEDTARPNATDEQARALAEDFLRARMRRDPAGLEFVETAEVERPHRTDRTFTWKERDFNLKDATYRVEVTLLGNEVAAYREYLKVPEQWTRDYKRLRSKNEAASTVDLVFMTGMLVGLVVVIVLRVRGHDVRWRRAAVVGIIGMALSFLSSLNQMPLEEFAYPTTDSYSSFILRQLLNGLLSALATGGFLFVLAAGAEPLYREMFPDRISLANLFQPRGLRTKRFFLGATLGVTLTGIFIAYQTAFYIVAYKFGAWSPADVPYSDLLNTRFPWLFVLFGGFFPAVFEEFMFRMFGIPFLRKLTRSMAVAVVLAGFIWGFGHAGYPQQPFYIRGVEVGLGGVALGMVMLRWGILPTLVWHYSVDAMYSAMLLMRSQNLYFRLSGAASAGVIVLPILVALVAYWRNGGFEPETGLLNADEEKAPEPAVPPPAPVETPEAKWQPLGARARIAAFALLAIGLAATLVPVDRFGASPKYKLSQAEPLADSDAFLRAQGIDPAAFHHVTVPSATTGDADDYARKYLLERLPLSAASAMFEEYRPVQRWQTRYFKPLDQEEMLVAVHPETGKVLGYIHTLPEDQPGADAPEPAARAIAAAFAAGFGWDTGAMDLKENHSEKRKARRDYTFIWEARPGDRRNVDEARFRVETAVAGDRAASAKGYWKLPERYERARDQQNFISISAAMLKIAVLAFGIVAALWLLVRKIREGAAPWRPTLKIAAVAAVLMGAGSLLSLDVTLMQYPTTMPLEMFRGLMFLGILLVAALGFVMLAAATGLVTAFHPDVLTALRAAGRRALARDAAVALAAAVGLALAGHQIELALISRFHAQALVEPRAPVSIVSKAPALASAAGALEVVLLCAAALTLIGLVARRLARPWAVPLLAALLAFAFLPSDIRKPGEFALAYALALMTTAGVAVFAMAFARRNYLAYAVVLWTIPLRGALGELYGNTRPVHFWLTAAIVAAGVLWALLPSRKAAHV